VIEGTEAVRAFEQAGVRLFIGVPDSLMAGFCAALQSLQPSAEHLVAANEGGAVAVAAGHYLATGRPAVVYMQNSGLGNAVNPLSSLASRRVYGIPMVLLIGWRGQHGVRDEPQHEHQGSITMEQLELLDIPTTVLGPDDSAEPVLEESVSRSLERNGPVAILVRKGTFAAPNEGSTLVSGFKRMKALKVIVETLPDETAYVATTGYTSRELALLRSERGQAWDRDLLMVGSMGHASALALGIAKSAPDRVVCCLDGDGAVAMHMGSMALIGLEQPPNLIHLVLNNGMHESVGGQPSALRAVDLVALAKAVGYQLATKARDADELRSELQAVLAGSEGPALIDVRIVSGTVEDLLRPGDFEERAKAMRAWLTGG
jgi:phosphonopyruvate decarboxylase